MYNPKATFSPQRPVTTVKLCSQCKFYKPVLGRDVGFCTLCGEIDLITGKKEMMQADIARSQLCGEDEGNFFMPGPNEPPALFYFKEFSIPMPVQAAIIGTLAAFVMTAVQAA